MNKEKEEICECGHLEIEHNFGRKGSEYGCGHSVDYDGESYGLCDCKKFKLKNLEKLK